MRVAKNTVVTLDYSVADPDGNVVDPGREPLVYLHGGYDDIFAKIEEALQGRDAGDTVKVKLQPEEAFGDYDAELIQIEPRDKFPKELEIGMQFEGGSNESTVASDDDDDDGFILYRVTDIAEDKVVLDGNHPLAGIPLVFTCTVTEVRAASNEEIKHGHAHEANEDEEDDEPTCH